MDHQYDPARSDPPEMINDTENNDALQQEPVAEEDGKKKKRRREKRPRAPRVPHQAGMWSVGGEHHYRHQNSAYPPPPGGYADSGTGQASAGAAGAAGAASYGWYSAGGGFNGFGSLYISPQQTERNAIKRTINRLLPALLLLFLVEYVAAALIASGIDLLNYYTAFTITYGSGSYDILTSYLPVILGEIAAILYLRGMSRISFKRIFGRPIIPGVYPTVETEPQPEESEGARPAENAENIEITEEPSPEDGRRKRRRPRKEKSRRASGGFWKSAGWVLFAAVAGIGFSMIGQLMAMVELSFLESVNFPFYAPDFGAVDYTILETIIMYLYVCLIGPIIEEIIFRGFILKGLQKHGVPLAVIVSSAFFALYHMNLVQLCVPILVGIFLAMLTVRTDSIWPAILCHILNNSLSMFVEAFMPQDPVWSWVFLLIETILFVGILVIFWIHYGKHFSIIFRWQNPVLRLPVQIGSALGSWSSIAYIALYLIMIIASSVMTLMGGW